MKGMNMKCTRTPKMTWLFAVLSVLILAAGTQAAIIEWSGTDGEYTDGANWIGGTVPDLAAAGNTALITSGAVTYTPGGDLAIHNGSTLQISGGSFIQAGGIAWMQFQGGNILVDGGTFSQGSAGNLLRDASSSVTCTAGTINWTGNLLYDPTSTGALTLSGTGAITTTAEFKPIADFSMGGGTLSANLISFADGPGGIDLSGGRIVVDGSAFGYGIYGGSVDKSIDFVTDSSGELFISNFDLATLTTSAFLSNGTITYNGAVDAGAFSATEVDGGVLISMPVPEPATIGMLALGSLVAMLIRRFRG
jgi:hypothetical protein